MSRKRSREALEALPRALRRGRGRARASTRRPRTRVYDKLVGFSGFGFPKSHAAAFGLLAYQSAWLRHHYPAEFLCALLNAQPMGFYPPATLVRDAQRRGVEVLPAGREPERARAASLEGERGADRASSYVARRSGRTRPRRSSPSGTRTGRIATSRDLARRAHALPATASRRSSRAGACDGFGRPRRELLWELGLVCRAAVGAGHAAAR